MPHTINGHVLREGDSVLVPCRVRSVQEGEEFCNVTLETEEVMPPYETGTSITLNTHQVELRDVMIGNGDDRLREWTTEQSAIIGALRAEVEDLKRQLRILPPAGHHGRRR